MTEGSIILHSNLASYLERDHMIVIEVDRAQNLAKSLRHKNPFDAPQVRAAFWPLLDSL